MLSGRQGFKIYPQSFNPLSGSWIETIAFLPDLAGRHTAVFVFGLLAGAFYAYFFIPEELRTSKSSIAIYFGGSLLFVLAGIGASIAPAFILRGGLPPQRVLLSAYFLAACLAIYWGILSALFLRSILPQTSLAFQRWTSLGLLVFMMIWGVLPFAISQLELVPPLQNYSSLWDERHQTILAAPLNGESVIVTTDLTKVKTLERIGFKTLVGRGF